MAFLSWPIQVVTPHATNWDMLLFKKKISATNQDMSLIETRFYSQLYGRWFGQQYLWYTGLSISELYSPLHCTQQQCSGVRCVFRSPCATLTYGGYFDTSSPFEELRISQLCVNIFAELLSSRRSSTAAPYWLLNFDWLTDFFLRYLRC